jgi:hypothetical protein
MHGATIKKNHQHNSLLHSEGLAVTQVSSICLTRKQTNQIAKQLTNKTSNWEPAWIPSLILEFEASTPITRIYPLLRQFKAFRNYQNALILPSLARHPSFTCPIRSSVNSASCLQFSCRLGKCNLFINNSMRRIRLTAQTQRLGRAGSTPPSHAGGRGFECRKGRLLPWLGYFVVSFGPYIQVLKRLLGLFHDGLFFLPIHHSSITF